MRRMVWQYPGGAKEIRDGLDAGWWRFLQMLRPARQFLPLPNIGAAVEEILVKVRFSGFIFTGGDDWGVFPERDATEKALFSYGLGHGLRMLGVCRGAQIMNQLAGGINTRVSGHVGTRHPVFMNDGRKREVNSWHSYAISRLAPGFETIARDAQGAVESYAGANGLVAGIMWHPEREEQPDPDDMALLERLFHKAEQ